MKTEITPETVKEYFEFQDALENEIIEKSSFVRSNDLRVNLPFKGGYDSYQISSETISVKFSESWAYGGYDEYYIDFPISYLYLTTDQILSELEPINKAILIAREVVAKNQKDTERKQDLAKIKELKAKLKIPTTN